MVSRGFRHGAIRSHPRGCALDSDAGWKYLSPMTDEIETLDALGMLCPLPVLKARKRLKSLPAGGVLRVLADDPAAIIDVPHFCTESGHTLVSQDTVDGHQIYVIRKSA